MDTLRPARRSTLQRALPFLAVFLIASLDARASGRLFVNSPAYDHLEELDPLTGALIGSTAITGGTGVIGSMVYDALTDMIFMSDTTNHFLWRLDYHTGAATLVGPYNVGGMDYMHGLAIDDTGQLFGASIFTGGPNGSRFFRISRSTGAATLVTAFPQAGFTAIEFVAATQTMYCANFTNQQLYTVDRVTGATTLVGPFGISGQMGVALAYDSTWGMYALNNSGSPGLYKVNLATGSATLITSLTGNRIALTFVDVTPSTSFCTGDAVGTTCLACGNNGGAGRGCANSSFSSGAQSQTLGVASVANDTLVLRAKDVTGPGLFFQANAILVTPLTFGDGMLCATAGLIRLGVVFPIGGIATYPGGITPHPVSVSGAPIAAGDVKHYQCWYRDAAAFCSADTFNLTQGVSLTWTP